MTNIQQHSYRVAKIEIFARETRAHLGDATGFFCYFEGGTFLVTNWHVVSGRHFQTERALHPSRALPGSVRVHAHIGKFQNKKLASIASSAFNIALDNEDQCWLEHPLFGSRVDVVAIPVDPIIRNCQSLFPIDLEEELERPSRLAVMDQAFVTGYPLNASTTPNSLPIYKSGTIASEPYVFDAEPRIYIDGKTKTGMSGSPVVVKRRAEPQSSAGQEEAEHIEFIGVYSGRDRQERSEFEAELGIVWPFRECLLPIVDQIGSARRKRSGESEA